MGNQQETTPNKFISKEELEDLYINKKLSDAEIGKLYNMSVGKIHRIRGKYNIKKINTTKDIIHKNLLIKRKNLS